MGEGGEGFRYGFRELYVFVRDSGGDIEEKLSPLFVKELGENGTPLCDGVTGEVRCGFRGGIEEGRISSEGRRPLNVRPRDRGGGP